MLQQVSMIEFTICFDRTVRHEAEQNIKRVFGKSYDILNAPFPVSRMRYD